MAWMRRNETTCQLLVAALLALIALSYTDAANPHGVPSIDSGTFLYLGMVIQHGGMPYADAFDHKGPLIYLINTLALGLGHWRMIAVFEGIALAAALFFTFRIAWLRAGFFSSLAITTLCTWLMTRDMLDFGNLTEEYAMPWIALAALLFLRFFQTGELGRRALFFIGFSLSMMVALRPNMIAVWTVGIPMTVWLLARQKCLRQGILWAFGGFAAGLAPFLLWLAAHGALTACWEAYIVFNLHYTHRYLELVQQLVPAENRAPASMMGRYPVFVLFAKKGAWQSAALCLLAMAWQRQWRDGAAWAALVMLLLGLLLNSMSAMPFGHYGMAVLPTLAYPLAVFCSAVERLHVRSVPAGRYALMLGSVAFAVSVAVSSVEGYIARCHQPQTPENIHMYEAASYIRSHTSSDDRILVCGIQTAVYPLSGRLAASRYSYQFPIVYLEPERRAEFLEEINASLPKMIIARNPMPKYEPEELEAFMQVHGYEPDPGYAGTEDLTIYVQSSGLNDRP